MPEQFSRRMRRRLLAAGVVLALTGSPSVSLAVGPSAPSPAGPHTNEGGAIDVRRPIASDRALAVATVRGRAQLGADLGRQGVFDLDPRTGTVRVLARLDGFLTGPSPRSPDHIVMDFVAANLDAIGLARGDLRTFVLRSDSIDVDGTHHLSWVQQAGGVRAFDNGLRASVTADGRLVSLTGSPARSLGAGAAAGPPGLSADAAIGRARTSVGAPAAPSAEDAAQLVWFHGARSTLAWQTLTRASAAERHLSVIDAGTGQILWQTNLVHDAVGTGSAWEYYPSTQVPGGGGTQQPVDFPVNGQAKLRGPNAWVYLDTNDDSSPDPWDQIRSASGLDWTFPADLDTTTLTQNCRARHACTWDRTKPKSWRANRQQNAVQVYHYLNRFHDHLAAAPIGFTSAAGNFEGADAVRAEILDGANTAAGLPDGFHYNNANMYTPPDGQPGILQLYLFQKDRFSPGWPSANAGDDASVVYHEYTHGMTGRLVTYANGFQALNTWQSAAMGEGWSDWYAMDFLEAEGFVENDPGTSGEVKVGEWITGGEGIRYQAIDCATNAAAAACPAAWATGSGGFTYGDYGRVFGSPQIHSDGEIWSQTLWDLRAKIGVATARRLITRGMRLSPPDPSFLDMRNAIVQADVVATGGANASAIWQVFAKRGMGYFASALDGDDVTPAQNFQKPPSCGVDPCGKIVGRVVNTTNGGPIKGVTVAIGGHSSGFPGTDLTDKTDARGWYVITQVPHHRYPDLVFDRWGLETEVAHGVLVNGKERIDRRVVRDWAAIDGGAVVTSATPPDYTVFGCGPEGAFDRSLGTGWGSDAPDVAFGSRVTGPRSVVVRLPRVIDVRSFAVDPGATCGDAPDAAVKAFDIYTRTQGGSWVLAYRRTSGLPQGVLSRVDPTAGTQNVRYVKLTMRSNRGNTLFMDLSELSVRGN